MSEDPTATVLIGGATGTGKSTVAAGVAAALGATVVHGDVLRAVVRRHLPKTDPAWFESFAVPVDSLMAGFDAQATTVRMAVADALAYGVREGWRQVAEGVHLVPWDASSHPLRAVQVLLVARDTDSHAARFQARENATSGGRGAAVYVEALSRIRQIQDELEKRAVAEGIPVLDVTALSVDETVAAVLEIVAQA